MRSFVPARRHCLVGLLGLAVGSVCQIAHGAVTYGADNPVSLGASTYTQDFNSLPATTGASANQTGGWYTVSDGNGNTGPRIAGWDIYTQANLTTNGGATGHDRLYSAGGTSTGNTGAFLSLGDSATAGSNRALGALASSQTSAEYMGVTFVNNSGSPITQLDISYTGEIWRSGGTFVSGSNPNVLTFQYKVKPTGGSTSIGQEFYGNTVASLTYQSPSTNNTGTAATYDGDLPTSTYPPTTLSGVIDLSASPLQVGDKIALKWVMPGAASASVADALAIDNLTVTPTLGTALPEPASIGLIGVAALALRRRRRN